MKLLTKRIGVLGYGVEGKSLVTFLQSRRVRDLKIFDEKNPDFSDFTDFSDRDVLIRSPGVSPYHPALQNFCGKIVSGAELFLQLCPTKKVIGVTGTKGKGTASTLISRIFEEANDTVHLVGNIGIPFFDELPNIRTRDVVVTELSSFQLWDCQQSPQIAVVLRISPDHLEKHQGFDEYVSAKKNIFLHQKSGGKVVYCADCPVASAMVEGLADETLFPFSLHNKLEQGAFLVDDQIIWKTPEGEELIAEKEDVRLRGEFNLENVLAAVAAAKLLNARTIPVQTAIQKFTGLPYRMQLVAASRNGIQFWNDSCATTPNATAAGIGTFDEPLILIAGGSDKNADYTPLGEAIANHRHLKKLILIGKTGPRIEEAIKKAGGGKHTTHYAKDFAEVFEILKKFSEDNDNILLSPASASFDMFQNEFDRAEKWNAAVNEFLKVI